MHSEDRERELLARINALLPADIDWKDGARAYLKNALPGDEYLSGPLNQYSYTKPFASVADGGRKLDVFVDLMYNFVAVVELLRLPEASRVLDVACGAGWMSHYFARLGYHSTGIDISADMVACADRRVKTDPSLPPIAAAEFYVCDLETELLPEAGVFHAAVFESCLHHFYNPIAALRHVAAGLRDDGIVILIEGENRRAGILPEYMAEMERFATIERPYSRQELIEILELAGLPCYEFCGHVRGWIPPRLRTPESVWGIVTEYAGALNHTVCAKNPGALRRVLPGWTPAK